LKLDGDELLGAKIVQHACEISCRQIAFNAGFDGSVILGQVMKAPTTHGFNALTEQVEDLIAAGVIDPAKVVKHTCSLPLLLQVSSCSLKRDGRCKRSGIKHPLCMLQL